MKGGANTMQALLTLKSTKQLSMTQVEWGGIVGTYSSVGKSRQKPRNPPNGDYFIIRCLFVLVANMLQIYWTLLDCQPKSHKF